MKIYKAFASGMPSSHLSTALAGAWTRRKSVARAYGGLIVTADIDAREIAQIPKRLAGAIGNGVYSPWRHEAKFKRLKKDFPNVGALDVGAGAFQAEQEIFVLRVSALQNIRILRKNRKNPYNDRKPLMSFLHEFEAFDYIDKMRGKIDGEYIDKNIFTGMYDVYGERVKGKGRRR